MTKHAKQQLHNQISLLSYRFSKPLNWNIDTFINLHTKMFKVFDQLCKNFIFQREDTGNNPHYQCYLNVKKKRRPKTFAILMNDLMPGGEASAASNNGRLALELYCMKEDTRIQGPWAKDVYKLRQQKYQLEDNAIVKYGMLPWQSKLYQELIYTKAHPRRIIWYYDRGEGCVGKSTFAKYMLWKHNIITLTFGDARDLLNLVYKFQFRKTYMLDLSRTKSKKNSIDDIYYAIEEIKKGHFINTKYETGYVMMPIPHIVVFSNYPPKKGALSRDMLDVRIIEPKNPIKDAIFRMSQKSQQQ